MGQYVHRSVLLLCILALFLSGCGGSGGSAADPMGTATVQFIDEDGKVLFPEEGGGLFAFAIMPGESRQLIVWVTNARDGGATIVPVVNEQVTFTLLTPENGGSIRMVGDGKTDAQGRAVGMYTAGNNFQFDEVRATTEAGASAQLTLMKTGGLVGKTIASLTASPSEVAAEQPAVVTARVTDGVGNPVQGEIVRFSIASNASGGRFIGGTSATTDITGTATAVYAAGSNSATFDVFDTLQATISNGVALSTVITRSAGTPSSGATITLVASPTAVNGGSTSVITATVIGGSNAGANETVTLTIPVNASGGRFLNAAGTEVTTITLTTGTGGTATAIYKAGTTSSGTSVQDTIQGVVSSSGAIGSVTVTRNAGSTGYIVTVTANPATQTKVGGGDVSLVTANVKDSTGLVASNVSVAFTRTPVASGTMGPTPVTTDGAGNAVTNWTSTAAGSVVITATVTIGVNNYTGSAVITVP